MNVGSKEIFNEDIEHLYPQTGIVAWFDGIWNEGINKHSATATTWKDLAGSNDATKSGSGITWKSNCWTNQSQGQGFTTSSSLTQVFKTSYTAEFLIKPSRTTTRECFGSAWTTDPGISFEHNSGGSAVGYPRWYYTNSFTPGFNYDISGSKLLAGSTYLLDYVRNGNDLKVFVNGNLVWTGSNSFADSGSAAYHIGSDVARPQMAFYGDFFKHIVWNRPLSNAEVVKNYEIDKERFGL